MMGMVSRKHQKRNARLKAWQPQKNMSRSKRRNPTKRRMKKLRMRAMILLGEFMADDIWDRLNRPSRTSLVLPPVPVDDQKDT